MNKTNNFSNKDFCHFHVHTEYSSFDGLSKVDELVNHCRRQGFPALALTDHGNIGASLEFLNKCEDKFVEEDSRGKEVEYPPIKPILGCLLSGQEIVTENGVKSVENIEVGDKVLTHKGRYKKVTRTMTRRHSGTFYRIKLAHGTKRELVLTDEHPILVSDRHGNIDWRRAGEIKPGRSDNKAGVKQWNSYACLPKISSQYATFLDVRNFIPYYMRVGKNSVYQVEKENKYASFLNEWSNIQRYLDLDYDLSYFLGLFCAEGRIYDSTIKTGVFGLSFSLEEYEYAEFCVNFLSDRFNVKAYIYRYLDHNQINVHAWCLPLAHIFANLCGESCYKKEVPSIIFKAHRSIKQSFIQALIDVNSKGSSKKSHINNQSILRTVSKSLAWGFRQLLVDSGYWVSVDTVFDEKTDKVTYIVPFKPSNEYTRNWHDNNYVFKPISEIAYFEDSQDVYNFEVEEDHSYVSDFILHNCEFYLARKQEWKSKDQAEVNGGYQPDGRKGNRHINLFAMNWTGYQNLCTLSEKSWIDGYYNKDPRIDVELLAEYSEGLMAGSACLSSVINANLSHDNYDNAKRICHFFKDLFGENFFLEAMYHGIPDEKQILPDIFRLSKEMDIPVIATNDAHYIRKDQARTQEVLMCMSTSNCLTNPKHIKYPYDEFYVKSANEMAEIFGHVPQSLYNSVAMAERIDTDDIKSHLFGGMRLPHFELPEGFETSMQYLVHLAKQGMKQMGWDESQKHIDALKKELQDIQVARDNNNYDFATYFLIVWDYVNYARKQGIITGCGRGSGYGSVLLRCLGITYGPDPLAHNLLWERFLGFEQSRFVKESDFGFVHNEYGHKALQNKELNNNSYYQEDQGGVDRY